MNVVSKWVLARLGRMRPAPATGDPEARIVLPPPDRTGGMPLMAALARRRSDREFDRTPLTGQQLSDLLWAADGINRPDVGEHTAPSAMNAQEIDVYVALAEGLYRYDPGPHALELVAHSDARRVTGLQEFVDVAPVDLVYVADHRRMVLIPEGRRVEYAAICAGAIAQNVYLYCASAGLATVVRGLFDHASLGSALELGPHQHVVLTQTVGCPAR
jgi:SagB-type dehydrogenase family enzyme